MTLFAMHKSKANPNVGMYAPLVFKQILISHTRACEAGGQSKARHEALRVPGKEVNNHSSSRSERQRFLHYDYFNKALPPAFAGLKTFGLR